MLTSRYVAAVVLVGLGVGVGYLSAQDRGSRGELTAEDRLAIQDLYWRYAHGQNFADAELFASAFSEDGVFRVSPTRAAVGRERDRRADFREHGGQGRRFRAAALAERVADHPGAGGSARPRLLACVRPRQGGPGAWPAR